MEHKNRNTALVLLAAGLYLLLGNMIGFLMISALIVIWLGIYKIREAETKVGYVLLIVGGILFLGDNIAIVILIILISLAYFYIKSKQLQKNEGYEQKQHFLASIKHHEEPWVLKNSSIWSVIGEIRMDLSLALFEESEETTLIIQGVIGDIDIIVPEDVGISVSASVLFGQVEFGRERESGVMNKIVWHSPDYEQCEHKVKLLVSYIIGDIDIRRL